MKGQKKKIELLNCSKLPTVSIHDNHYSNNISSSQSNFNNGTIKTSSDDITVQGNSVSSEFIPLSDVKREHDNVHVKVISCGCSEKPVSAMNMDREHSLVTFEPVKTKKWFHSLKGFIYAVLSGFCFACSSFLVKELIDYSLPMVSVYRFVCFALFTTPMAYSHGKDVFGPTNLRPYLYIRGVALASNLYLRYIAYQLLYIADATVIILSMPVFVFIFAKIFLNEPFTRFHFVTLVIVLLGVATTSKINLMFGIGGEGKPLNPYGLAAAFGATLVGTSMFIVGRKLKSLQPAVILNNMAWVALIQSLIINFFFGEFSLPTSGTSTLAIVSLGMVSFYGQFFLTLSLMNEEAGFVSIVRGASQVGFAFLFQICLLHHASDMYSICGAIMVLFGIILIGLRKYILTLPKDNCLRQKLSCFLK